VRQRARELLMSEGEAVAFVSEATPKRRTQRLPRAGKPFIRTPAEWITNRAFDDRIRLLWLLIREAREGIRTEPIAVTGAFAAKAGISPYNKNRCLRHWQEAGLIGVHWRNGAAPYVTVQALDL
jgi:hypothetical protein